MKLLSFVLCALFALIAVSPVRAQSANPVPTQVPTPFKVGTKAVQTGTTITLPLTVTPPSTEVCPVHGTLWLFTGAGNTGDDLASATLGGSAPTLTLQRGTRVHGRGLATDASINMAWITEIGGAGQAPAPSPRCGRFARIT